MRPGRLALALVALLLAPAGARASTEEFSTLDVVAQELDDESVIDHDLTVFPVEWRAEWERAPQALRASEGCLTSANWFMLTQLRTSSPLGKRARFALVLDQDESDRASWNNLELWARFAQPLGTLGVMFRPYADKSRHDMALSWGLGADSTAWQLEATWGFEDLFNNLWAFRQTRVGGRGEPYLRHPWEPAIRMAARRPRWRAEVLGRYLTPSEKRLAPLARGGLSTLETLWGTRLEASLEVATGPLTWLAATENLQSAGGAAPDTIGARLATERFQRTWTASFGARAALAPRWVVEGRWSYTGRSAAFGAFTDPDRFGAVDRVLQGEVRWTARPSCIVRLGGLYDRVSVNRSGPLWIQTEGTRNESRAYFGFLVRMGRVSASAVEGIELDPEPYQVTFHHDKAFAQLQTTF